MWRRTFLFLFWFSFSFSFSLQQYLSNCCFTVLPGNMSILKEVCWQICQKTKTKLYCWLLSVLKDSLLTHMSSNPHFWHGIWCILILSIHVSIIAYGVLHPSIIILCFPVPLRFRGWKSWGSNLNLSKWIRAEKGVIVWFGVTYSKFFLCLCSEL